MFVVAVGTMALIIVLSVFNGLEELLKSLYNTFDPEIKIEARYGKSFAVTDSLLQTIREVEGVEVVTEVIEDNAYVRYNRSEMVAVLKGVGSNFTEQHRLESAIVQGEMKLHEEDQDFAIVGRGVQYTLNIAPNNDFFALQIFYPKDVTSATANPERMLNRRNIMVGGIFALEKQYDEKYIFVPLEFARDLLDYGNRRTSLEVKTSSNFTEYEVQSHLKEVLGEDFNVLNSDEQHATILRTVKIEKFFVYLIFIFILSISSFNIFFALSMLAIDKRKDISILYSMGANNMLIRSIFLKEGAIISFSGATIGLILGFILVLLQQEFGIISMGMQTSVVNYYPVKMEFMDFVWTSLCIIIITLAASIRPAVVATKYNSLKYI
jgi:lipoprotein-releasing system permease protein